MSGARVRQLTIDTRRYYILTPLLPLVDVCIKSTVIMPDEFGKIEDLTRQYPNDPRLIEMVRMGGDASAKVPYLMQAGETPDSILNTLREIAQPHIERIESLPEAVRATIHLLLSTNTVPKGCEQFGIPALLEIDRVQEDMVKRLHELMKGRQLARDFQNSNVMALHMLDRDWPRLRGERNFFWQKKLIPEKPQMQYKPIYDRADRLVSVHELCVIVDSPLVQTLRGFIPPVLQRPLPEHEPVPAIGSADWLIREVGKIGRHFTRALLDIIKAHLAAEQIALEAKNYEFINRQAQEALREHIEKTP